VGRSPVCSPATQDRSQGASYGRRLALVVLSAIELPIVKGSLPAIKRAFGHFGVLSTSEFTHVQDRRQPYGKNCESLQAERGPMSLLCRHKQHHRECVSSGGTVHSGWPVSFTADGPEM
jgi:hypothetical protein